MVTQGVTRMALTKPGKEIFDNWVDTLARQCASLAKRCVFDRSENQGM